MQISKHQRRETLLRGIRKREDALKTAEMRDMSSGQASLTFADHEPLPFTSPKDHHHIADSQRYPEDITQWLGKNCHDPALKVMSKLSMGGPVTDIYSDQNFMPQLKDHFLARLLGRPYEGDEHTFTDLERDSIRFVNNRFYRHKVFRVNYTTYDMRRDQDSINARTHPDIMVLSHEDDEDNEDPHPFWYARVIGIFHFNVRYAGNGLEWAEPRRMEVLWVRWFGRDMSMPGGFGTRRLHRIGFVPSDDPNAFGFLDPKEVLRGVHLIPSFASGRTSSLLGPSIVRTQGSENDEDWVYFYVNTCGLFPSLRLQPLADA
jgi:hypothetical protein